MTESDPSTVPAPFNALPGDENLEDAPGPARRSLPLGRLGLMALFVVSVGLGQGIAVTMFFGGDDESLSGTSREAADSHAAAPGPEVPTTKDAGADAGSPAGPPSTEMVVAEDETAAPVHVEVPPAPAAPPVDDELSVARERLDHGDVEGARRIAGAWLLRVDGMAPTVASRAPEAYAILADVLRRDLERSRDMGDER